jgi:hypothetical protein
MAKPVRMLKLDPETHQLIEEVSKWLGMEPAKFVAEAVTHYLDTQREPLVNRVQERLNKLFDSLDEARTPKTGWGTRSGGWGSEEPPF